MHAHELTFGIEIETIATPQALEAGLRIGPYGRGCQVPYLPEGWTASRDSSISSPLGCACEIVSPVLRGEEGIRQVLEVLEALKAHGHRVNASCGVHIHVGWPADLPAQALARLVTIVAYLEKALYAITGTKRRERGRWCNGLRCYGNDKQAKPHLDRNRYHALNLVNLATGRKPTVEFRVFSGSLNPVKIAGWIQVCLGLVERAIHSKRTPKWNPGAPKGGWKKAGPGQSETERLMGYLAWGRGYARIHGGRMFGWISDAVPQDQIKAELRRLARKYDEMP